MKGLLTCCSCGRRGRSKKIPPSSTFEDAHNTAELEEIEDSGVNSEPALHLPTSQSQPAGSPALPTAAPEAQTDLQKVFSSTTLCPTLTEQISQLDDDNKALLTSSSVEDLEILTQELKDRLTEKHLESKANRMSRLIIPIAGFCRGVTSLTQAADNFQAGQLAWGCLQVVISLCIRFVDVIDHISECLEDLAKCLPRLDSLSTLHPTSGVQAALVDMKVCCAEFLLRVATFLQSNSAWSFVKLSWAPLDRDLRIIRDTIGRRRKDFTEEVFAAHMKSVSDFQTRFEDRSASDFGKDETIAALRSLVTVQAKSLDQDVSYRYIPFTVNPKFFGRPEITNRIEEHLQPGVQTPHRSLKAFLLYGLGGSGKTQLAVNFAYSHWDDYDVILWLGADSNQTLAEDIVKSTTAMGISKDDNIAVALTALHRWLGETSSTWLIVFDNADEPERLVAYWPRVSAGCIIVTSRDPMLDMNLTTDRCEVDLLSAQQGASMLLKVLDLSETADAKDRELAASIAQELDGIAMAISQMGGFMLQTRTPMSKFLLMYRKKGNAEKLNQGNTSIDHHEYRYTLASVWQMSYARLSTEAYDLLCYIAFLHPDQVPESMFLDCTDDGIDSNEMSDVLADTDLRDEISFDIALSSLIGQCLLRRNMSSATLSIHRQIQSNVMRQMITGQIEHFTKCFNTTLRLLYRAFPRQSPVGDPIPDWGTCEFYTRHVLSILEMYEEDPLVFDASSRWLPLLTELFCDCGVYLWARGRLQDSERLAKASIRVAETVLEPLDCLRAQPYTLIGCIYLRSENSSSQAESALQTALDIREKNAERYYAHESKPMHLDIQLANAYSNLGIQRKQVGKYAEAVELHKKSLSIKQKYPEEGMAFLLALSYNNLGKVRYSQGLLQDAVGMLERSVETMKSLDEEMLPRKAVFMCDLARAEAGLGNTGRAWAIFLEAVKILKLTIGEEQYTGLACYRFAAFLYSQGDLDQALLLADNAATIFSNASPLCDLKLAATMALKSLISDKQSKKSGEEDFGEEDFGEQAIQLLRSSTGLERDLKGLAKEDVWEICEKLLVHN